MRRFARSASPLRPASRLLSKRFDSAAPLGPSDPSPSKETSKRKEPKEAAEVNLQSGTRALRMSWMELDLAKPLSLTALESRRRLAGVGLQKEGSLSVFASISRRERRTRTHRRRVPG